jgi:hypothetical protein
MTVTTRAGGAGRSVAAMGADGRAGGGPGGRGGRGRVLFWVALLAAVVLLALVAGAPSPSVPLSPRSTAPEGTRGLVLFLEELGATVEVSRDAPQPSDDVALVLADDFGDDRREQIEEWLRSGGTLVVADAGSPLAADTVEDQFEFDFVLSDRGTCDIDALDGAERIAVGGTSVFGVAASAFEVSDGAASCFGDGDEALIVAARQGDGQIISVGDPDLFINENLDADDNAVVAAGLLAPNEGTTVRILEAPFQVRDRTLTDLIPENLILAFVQVLIAFGVYALWRARRLGRPVAETQPVEIAGSELVAAVGGLLEGAAAPERAGHLLQAELRRDLGVRFGIVPGTPPEAIAQVVGARTGVDPGRIHSALAATPPATDGELLELARRIESVRQEVFRGHRV